jgi:hypothetical protein
MDAITFWTALSAIATFFTVIVALVIALFQDWFRRQLFKERLVPCFKLEPPFLQKSHAPNAANPT